VEQQLVHIPEPALPRGGLGGGRRGEGVRVDAGQREVAEGESHVPGQVPFGHLDRVEGLPGVRALVIAVLDDQAALGLAADVIGCVVERRQGQLAVVRGCAAGHGPSPWWSCFGLGSVQ
jgi:hypothetical protein